MGIEHLKVPSEKLTIVCDPDDLGFESTDDLDFIDAPIGQERAIAAVQLALDIEHGTGFNLLISGPLGSGRNHVLRSIIYRIATTKPKANGLAYVHNFSEPREPLAIMLPPGMVTAFRNDMDDMIKTYRYEVLDEQRTRRAFSRKKRSEDERFEQVDIPMIDDLVEKYCDETLSTDSFEGESKSATVIRTYLQGVREDIIDKGTDNQHWDRYRVNVLVDNQELDHAPVVFDDSATYHSLFGGIDRESPYAPTVDFTLIKPGSLHRAYGGYLVLQARELIRSQGSLDTLKRTLRSRLLRIENTDDKDTPVAPSTIRPEPIPLSVRIIVVGTPYDISHLKSLDEEFDSYFKVEAQFDSSMDRTSENILKYGSFVATTVKDNGLRHFDKTAVARLIDYSSRLVEDQGKLTMIFQDIIDIAVESNYWAGARKYGTVSLEDVDKAIEQRKYRADLWKDKDQEFIEEGTVHIATAGSKVGQINGLSIMYSSYSRLEYGIPNCITAKVSLGRGHLVDVDREAKLTGRSHDKGFMILKGYLNGKYGQDKPLSLSASISIEQSGIFRDGDSASSTEVYALLSELSGLPISQGIAVTGAVNQNGDVQAIGGAIFKIEGFFDLCEARGLNGTQGVIVPRDNLKNLVLKDEVVEAVRDGLFHIYGVSTIDEGIEVLTGVPAGQFNEDSYYPEGTVHQLVEKRLREMVHMARDWEKEKDESA